MRKINSHFLFLKGLNPPPTTITTLVREDEHQRLEVLGQASNIKDTSRDDDRFYSLDIFDNW